MKINPLNHYAEPEFPTRSIIDDHPELLMFVPNRWRTSPVVLSALTAVCVLLSGCRSGGSPTPSYIAPIFVHGDGYGAFGCEAVNPPVFLSEDEARQVICDEAKRAGINFEKGKGDALRVRGPVTYIYDRSDKPKSRMRRVVMDGKDTKQNISYEFISESDFKEWHVGWLTMFLGGASTVSSFDIMEATQTLQDGLKTAKPEGTYAVFYDPCVGWIDVAEKQHKGVPKKELWEHARKVTDAQMKKLAKEELREQVRDFIKWLKAEGVI